LFCDDFEDGVPPAGWTFIKPAWNESGGALVGTPTKRKAVAVATPVFTGCTNCTIRTTMQSAGGIGNRVWLLGWYIDKRNTVELMMKQESGRWILKHKINGAVARKAKGILPIQVNVAYTVEMAFDGANITVSIDNTPLITMPPAGPLSGTVGFQAKGTTGTFQFIEVN
jgi:hypothetical protein